MWVSGMFLAGTAVSANAQITGNLNTTSVSYGPPITLQTINTGFGASAGGDSNNGSELDGAYGVINGSNVDIFLSGNYQNNGNHINIFLAGGGVGQAILNVPATATLQAMNGSAFSPGFQATYAYDANDYGGTEYCEEYTYAGPATLAGGYIGSLTQTSTGILPAGVPSGGSYPAYATIAMDNLNVNCQNAAAPGTAANPAQTSAVSTGFEISIPLSQIGYTGGPIMALADINGGGDTYLSNQFLPGLPLGTQNLGTPTFNFAATPGQYFTIAVPEPASMGVIGGAIIMLCARRRRA